MDKHVAKAIDRYLEHEARLLERYGEEVMSSGWNPQVTLAGNAPVAPTNRHVNLLADLVGDVDAFMKKMYEHPF